MKKTWYWLHLTAYGVLDLSRFAVTVASGLAGRDTLSPSK